MQRIESEECWIDRPRRSCHPSQRAMRAKLEEMYDSGQRNTTFALAQRSMYTNKLIVTAFFCFDWDPARYENVTSFCHHFKKLGDLLQLVATQFAKALNLVELLCFDFKMKKSRTILSHAENGAGTIISSSGAPSQVEENSEPTAAGSCATLIGN